MSITLDLRTALYTTLTAANTGAVSVYTYRPQAEDGGAGLDYPCIVLGDMPINDDGAAGANAFDAVVRVHTYSRGFSQKQCAEIQAAIFARLHRQSFPIANHILLLCDRETTDITNEQGLSHGICEYRMLIQQTVLTP